MQKAFTLLRVIIVVLVSFFSILNLSAQTGSCFIEVISASGIEVYLDNKYVGTTNSNDNGLFIQNINSGSHALKFVKEGFQPQRDAITLKQNQVLPYRVKPFKLSIKISQSGGSDEGEMVLETGTLIIQSLPTAITLKISALGINVQKTQDKVTLNNIPVGAYKAVFQWKGKVLSYNVEIEAKEKTHLMVNMVNDTVELRGSGTEYDRNPDDYTNNSKTMGKPCPDMPTVTDIDGNTYNTVLIGDQCWMQENLKVTHYPNGNAIPYITSNSAWGALGDNNTDDAYCYYDNNTNSEYGALYSYAAAIADSWERDNSHEQGICPNGWHLPTDPEWTVLTDYLGGSIVAGGKMKESGTLHWNSPNTGTTNESVFTALPGGDRNDDSGTFSSAGNTGYWWSAAESSSYYAWYRSLFYSSAYVRRFSGNKSGGFSVRCTRDY